MLSQGSCRARPVHWRQRVLIGHSEHFVPRRGQGEVTSPSLAPSADGDLATVHNVPVDATCERPPKIDVVSPTRLQVWRVVSADLMESVILEGHGKETTRQMIESVAGEKA